MKIDRHTAARIFCFPSSRIVWYKTYMRCETQDSFGVDNPYSLQGSNSDDKCGVGWRSLFGLEDSNRWLAC